MPANSIDNNRINWDHRANYWKLVTILDLLRQHPGGLSEREIIVGPGLSGLDINTVRQFLSFYAEYVGGYLGGRWRLSALYDAETRTYATVDGDIFRRTPVEHKAYIES